MAGLTDDRLRQAVTARRAITTCTRCSLRAEATQPIPWHGPLDPDLAILGEAPGRTEDREGKPFQGPAGRLLRAVLSQAGFDPSAATYLNAANCYPSRTHTPEPDHLAACNIHLVGQLRVIRPRFLLIVGTTAFSAVFGKRYELKHLRARPFYVERLAPWPRLPRPITAWATYHPAYALRSPTARMKVEDDVMSFAAWKNSNSSFPGTCARPRCEQEVDWWDEFAVPWCGDHKGKQLELTV